MDRLDILRFYLQIFLKREEWTEGSFREILRTFSQNYLREEVGLQDDFVKDRELFFLQNCSARLGSGSWQEPEERRGRYGRRRMIWNAEGMILVDRNITTLPVSQRAHP